jgi:hypothetical protein
MLGTEQRREPCAGSRAQDIDVAPAQVIDTGVVAEEAEALAGDETGGVGEEHFDARAHLS